MIIISLFFKKLPMLSSLQNLSVLYYENQIRMTDSGKSVGDNK